MIFCRCRVVMLSCSHLLARALILSVLVPKHWDGPVSLKGQCHPSFELKCLSSEFVTLNVKRNIVNRFSHEMRVISGNFGYWYNRWGDIFFKNSQTWKTVCQQLINIPFTIHFSPHLVLTIRTSVHFFLNFVWVLWFKLLFIICGWIVDVWKPFKMTWH